MIDNLIDWIRQIESGKVEIDHSAKSIRSNVTTNLMLQKITKIMTHNLHAKVFDWQIVSGLAYNAYELIYNGKNSNYNSLEVLQRNQELEVKLQKAEQVKEEQSTTIANLHKERNEIQRIFGKPVNQLIREHKQQILVRN